MALAGPWRALARLVGLLLLILVAWPAGAGVMTPETMARAFPAPLVVGVKDTAAPVWPIYRQELTSTVLLGYAYESIDLAPIPGFSGTPMNLLVLLDTHGVFVDLRVLSHHEPVFLEGLGPVPLMKFTDQYKGLALTQNIKIGSNQNRGGQLGSANVYIDGVAKATASVRILNQSLLSASLKVARAKLGYAAGRDPDLVARIRPEVYRPMDWDALVRAGLVRHVVLSAAEVEAQFKGTSVEGPAPAASAAPFAEYYIAHLNTPTVGRNLLSEGGWKHLLDRIDAGDHAMLLIGAAGYSFVGEDFTRGAVPDRLTLKQGDLPIEIRDLDLDDTLRLPAALRGAPSKVFRVIGPAGLDPARPFDFALHVTRTKGIVYPERVSRDFTWHYELPADYWQAAAPDNKTWRGIWLSRAWELAVLAASLVLLSAALARQSWLVREPGRLTWLRNAYLVYTLVFIGWYAQGQLSIVNLTAFVQAVIAGRSLEFFLYDPMTVSLWAFVAVTLVVWGRGTFCGWLCPFGALQELVSQIAQRLRIRRLHVHRRLDAKLKGIKYAVLGGILLTAGVSGAWTDTAVEIEPFKTAITLGFVRAWPFVVWAAGLALASAFVYKGYCRYLCPLGAALALFGKLRLYDWIPRRAECGTPCQTCRHRCEYQAIEPAGTVRYEDCFQCLDCVEIHDDAQTCAPLIVARRHGERVIAIQPLPPEGAMARGTA